jgi:hypothetical protein
MNKGGLILHLGDGIRKSKTKTPRVHDVNAKGIYSKNMTTT